MDRRIEQRLGQAQQGVAAHQVYLVERQHRLAGRFRQASGNGGDIGGGPAIGRPAPALVDSKLRRCVDQLDDGVRFPGAAPGGLDHGPVEASPWLEDAGRVHQDHLGLAIHGHAAHREARGLDLLGDDGDLLTDQMVDQGGLAGVGRPDHGHEARPPPIRRRPGRLQGRPSRRFSNLRAAAFSAVRRAGPSPVSDP